MNARPPLILLGAGGHAKVCLSLALAAGWQVAGVCDPELAATGETRWRDLPVLGDDTALQNMDPAAFALLNGIGQLVGSRLRQTLHMQLRQRGFRFPAMVHPTAWIDASCRLGEGCQVMAGAILQPDITLGEDCIVNTGACIDHDCRIGDHVHVAPGATLCGGVQVDNGAFIGSGATVIQGLHVGAGATVAAGAVLARNLAAGKLHMNKVAIRTDKVDDSENMQ